MLKPTLFDRIRYKFENTLSAGASAMIAWLGLATLIVILVSAAILTITGINTGGAESMGFAESMWQSFMRTVDPGTLAGDEGWVFRLISFLVTLVGIFILAILIGILTSSIEEKLDDLRKGRSKVLEKEHTLILGWNSKIFSIIEQLIIANENVKKPKIVVLADLDKVWMEDKIQSKIEDRQNTQIIVRSGNPLESSDLFVSNPNLAKSIIVLSPENTDNPDTRVIKTVLALTNNKKRKTGKYHIVAEIKDKDNMEAANLVSENEATYVLSSDTISKVTAQTSRQSGLSLVYAELLRFEGDEIYFTEEQSLIGKTYKEICFRYETSSIIGFLKQGEQALINPDQDEVFEAGDLLIAISEDDDTVILAPEKDYSIKANAIVRGEMTENEPERSLLLGWNEKATQIILELDNYLTQGSEITVVSEIDIPDEEKQMIKSELKNQSITFSKGDTTKKSVLNRVDPTTYKNIIVLSYDNMDTQESDAKTIITLLHVRNYAEQTDKPFTIVSEMLAQRNRELAEVSKSDDYIVSDNLVSLMLAQMSEDKNLKLVFDDLFDADGSEIYLKPSDLYIQNNTEVNFYTVLESAAQIGNTAIGYRKAKHTFDSDKGYGIVVNPKKDEMITFEEGDSVIVLALD